MAGHSRPKDGVASLAFVPAIHALLWRQGVDARDRRGHDERWVLAKRTREVFAATVWRNEPERSSERRFGETNPRRLARDASSSSSTNFEPVRRDGRI
jgi:hypothetical protein